MYKHQGHLAEAVATIRSSGIPISLDLIGPSNPKTLSHLLRVLKRFDESSSFIRYLGNVPYSELQGFYATADMFAFASSCENMPNILIEAMAAGLPIASSKCGPMPEVLQEAGIYFDPENPSDIASAIMALLESPKLRMEKAQAAYQLAQQYAWKRCARETFNFLSVIARGHK